LIFTFIFFVLVLQWDGTLIFPQHKITKKIVLVIFAHCTSNLGLQSSSKNY